MFKTSSLPEKLIEMVRLSKISHGHAKILVGLENAVLLGEKIIKKIVCKADRKPCQSFEKR